MRKRISGIGSTIATAHAAALALLVLVLVPVTPAAARTYRPPASFARAAGDLALVDRRQMPPVDNTVLLAAADRLEAASLGAPLYVAAASASLRAKVRSLGNLVTNLERAAEAGHPPSALLPAYDRRDRGRVVRTPTSPAAAPPNDDCADAIVIGDGTVVGDTSEATNDGQATCGSSLLSPDVWFKYVAGDYGYVSADTFGSAYDTVLSVHTACPGTRANEIRCNDDAFGLQSAVSFYTSVIRRPARPSPSATARRARESTSPSIASERCPEP